MIYIALLRGINVGGKHSTREVYLDLPSGVGLNKLADKVVRTFPDATLRNWRTVLRLAEMLDSV